MGKCECVLFGPKRKLKSSKGIEIPTNGQPIKSKACIKYLGSLIDCNMSGKDMVENIVKKSNNRLKFLYRNAKHLSFKTRKILCTALIQSNIDYGCMSWYHSLNCTLKRKLQIIQNKMVRFILNEGPMYHVGNSELNKLSLLNIENRVCQLSLNLVHSIYNNTGPTYFQNNFVKTSHNYNTRFSNHSFVVPKVNTITSTTFYSNAIKQWNSLPLNVKEIPNKSSFKSKLKKHLLHQQIS